MEVQYDVAFRKFVEARKRLDDPWYRQLVGARLKVLRLGKRLHQNAVAGAAGISKSKLCRIEKGVFPVKLDDAIAIGEALGVSVEEFLSEEPEHAAM